MFDWGNTIFNYIDRTIIIEIIKDSSRLTSIKYKCVSSSTYYYELIVHHFNNSLVGLKSL